MGEAAKAVEKEVKGFADREGDSGVSSGALTRRAGRWRPTHVSIAASSKGQIVLPAEVGQTPLVGSHLPPDDNLPRRDVIF